MGKNRRPPRAELRRRLARYNDADLWSLSVAAGASPGVRHRWPTVGNLVSKIARIDRQGRKPVGVEQLEQILADCVEDEPRLASLEDFVPADPRDVVRVRLGRDTVRLLPGCVERPVADVDRALMVARAIDELVIARRGFGVSHVLEVILGYADAAIQVLHDAWPDGDIGREGPVVLTQDELNAATRLIEMGTPPDIVPTEQHQLALNWLTCDGGDLPYEPSDPQSPFGRFVRFRAAAGGPPRWLPAAFLPEILGFAVNELAREAAAIPGANHRFAQEVAAETRRILLLFGPLYGANDQTNAPVVSSGNVVQWVSMRTPGRAVLVQVVTGLRLTKLPFDSEPEALRAARALAADQTTPIAIRMPAGELRADPATEAVPLLVIGSPGHVVAPQRPGLPAMSLDDLRWAARSATSRGDLFTYCRDMSRPDLPPFFSWEAIDIWEWWRSNGKSFFSGGQSPSFVSVGAHAGEAEWRAAAKNSPLEQALAQLELPPLREIVGIDHGDNGPPAIYSFAPPPRFGQSTTSQEQRDGWYEQPDLVGWTVHLSRVPVAVSALKPEWEKAFVELLSDLSGAFGFALRAVDRSWVVAHAGTGIVGHVIELSLRRCGGTGPMIRLAETGVAEVSNGRLVLSTLAVDGDAFDTDDTDFTASMHDAMAEAAMEILLAAGINAASAGLVGDAWLAAPPMLAMEVVSPPTVRNDQTSPVELDDSLISQVERRVAEAVRAAGVEPDDYMGERAKALDRDVLAPAVLAQLNETLSAHRIDDLVLFGMQELERCLSRKDRDLRDIRQSAAKLQVEWDPATRYEELEAKYLLLRRCCETAVEAALRSSSTGKRPVDSIAWGEILAASHAYLQATMRSEGIHHQLSPTLLRVSESWEISTHRDESGLATLESAGAGKVYDLDPQALGRLRAAELLSDPVAEATTSAAVGSAGAEAKESLEGDRAFATLDVATGADAVGDSPGLGKQTADGFVDGQVDAAMLAAYGVSGTDVLTVLFALAHWPLSDEDEDAVPVERDAVLDYVLEITTLGDEPEGRSTVEAAVKLLTSTSTELRKEDWKPWQARSRKRRILIQPLATLSDGRLVVGPHLCLGSLTVYRRYLDQGQLPWTHPQPPAKVEQALEEVRDRRNKALERQVAALLREGGWTVIENVKENKAARLNVPHLQTEVDAVAGRAGTSTIWLLEVKDPADVFAVADIRRALDRFFVDGKKPAYATQLRRKYDDLSAHAVDVADALGLPLAPQDNPYIIKPMFVTRAAVPAAFVTSPFPFTSLAGLSKPSPIRSPQIRHYHRSLMVAATKTNFREPLPQPIRRRKMRSYGNL